MKRLSLPLLLMNIFLFCGGAYAQEQGYRLEVTIDGYEGEQVYLGYRREEKIYSKDTVGLTGGKYIFEGAGQLNPGIYLILMPPENKFFEFVVTRKDQHFSIFTSAPEYFKNLRFTGSEDNRLLHDYQLFMNEQVALSKEISASIDAAPNAQRKAMLEGQLKDIGEGVRAYQDRLIAEHPQTYAAKLVAGFQDPIIPDPPVQPDGTIDSSFRFRYYRAHYWDGFDLAYEPFINTPYLKEKIDRYLDKLTLQVPDSVIAAVDTVLSRAEKNDEVLKYVLPYLLQKYYVPEIMGLDAVYVHLSDQYYKTGKAFWATPESLKKITDEAYMMKGVLIGKSAPDVKVQRYDRATHQFTDNLISPYDVPADYTVIFLWKPGCGHCKKMTDELKPFYQEWRYKGVEIFSISSAGHMDLDKALEDINEKRMPWIITADPYQRARALQHYYGTSLPKLYILDKDKKVIASRVGVQQLPKIIEDHRSRQSVDK